MYGFSKILNHIFILTLLHILPRRVRAICKKSRKDTAVGTAWLDRYWPNLAQSLWANHAHEAELIKV